MDTTIQRPRAVTSDKIREAVRRIAEACRPLKIFMFGSQARGNGNLDSDLDLMIIMEEVGDPVGESVRLRRLLKGMAMAVDILVVDHAKFDYWQHTPGNIYYEVAQGGKLLYEAG